MLVFAQEAQEKDLLMRMAAMEKAARAEHTLYSYLSDERSTRTNGHLWRESVVETDDGPIRRLLEIDGRPLTADERNVEDRRLATIEANPEVFRKLNEAHQTDEISAVRLLQFLPEAFLLSPDGMQDGCTVIAFKPNPAYVPSTYEERVVHAMVGTVAVKEPVDRLCRVEATIAQPVEFGYGFLGKLNAGGRLGLERVPVDGQHWKTAHIVVHINGRVLMMKSLTREQETNRGDIRMLTTRPTIAEAIEMTKP
jgi:hypothetical protein